VDRKVFTALLLAAVVVGLVFLAVRIFQPFLLAMLWAAVIVTVTHDAYEQLARWAGGRRGLAALIMTFLVLLLIMGPFLSLALHFWGDVANLVERAQSEDFGTKIQAFVQGENVQWILGWLEKIIGEPVTEGKAGKFAITKLLPPTAEVARDVAGLLFELLWLISFISISTFYLYRDGPKFAMVCRELLPMRSEDSELIVHDLKGAVLAAVRGGLLTAIVQGLLGFIILFFLDVGQPVLWASLISLASFIPLVGTAIIWIPMAGWLLLDGQTAQGIILIAYGILVISMADNFLRPILVGQHMEAHSLMLFFGILGGIGLFGFSGIVLGPVVVAFLNATTRLFRREFAKIRADEEAEAPSPA
jgi:predicted PurR-regulated permease PerM